MKETLKQFLFLHRLRSICTKTNDEIKYMDNRLVLLQTIKWTEIKFCKKFLYSLWKHSTIEIVNR